MTAPTSRAHGHQAPSQLSPDLLARPECGQAPFEQDAVVVERVPADGADPAAVRRVEVDLGGEAGETGLLDAQHLLAPSTQKAPFWKAASASPAPSESADVRNTCGDQQRADADVIAELTRERGEAIRQQAAALDLVSRIRQALGDDGRRMQDELIEWCKTLRAAEAERDELRAQMAATRLKLAHDVEPWAATDLLSRVLMNLSHDYGRRRRKPWPFWAYIRESTSLGSNCSAGLARWAGLDPDTGRPIIEPVAEPFVPQARQALRMPPTS